jgi:two-component system LytT family sensor kinase
LLIAVRSSGMGAAIFMLTLPTMILANYIAILDQIVFDREAALFDFSYLLDPIDFRSFDWAYILDEALTRYFILVSWGALYLALSHSQDVQRMMAHSRQLERVNQESELRALRYQLNPHFVFNALNSVSSLIIDRKNEQAEKLVDDLADYMRAVLTGGTEDMIAVEQEIAQQVRYLEIERVRFPERLHYIVNIDPAANVWSIPALIIQPLIENAVKFGVSGMDQPINIIISAQIEGDRLRISVANDGRIKIPAAQPPDRTGGTGTGLTNIHNRLRALYRQNASLVDDEPLARSRLKALCERTRLFGEMELANGGRQAVEKIRQRQPDIVLLDVDMPDYSGLKVAEFCQGLARMPEIIFTTAHSTYAVQAFRLEATDYLEAGQGVLAARGRRARYCQSCAWRDRPGTRYRQTSLGAGWHWGTAAECCGYPVGRSRARLYAAIFAGAQLSGASIDALAGTPIAGQPVRPRAPLDHRPA